MIPLSLAQIATITDGQLARDVDTSVMIKNISTDTRAVSKGDLFIALQGDNFDAHDFIEQATAAKATAVVVAREVNTCLPQIRVADTRKALGQIAREVKRQADVKTIAITGSCGKTTVKEMLASICRQVGSTHATAGNFNNEIGVPLTLLGLTPEHDYAVVELGANHIGEIAYTVSLVEPDAALITNISGAHLEGFGSMSGVASAKGEIFSGVVKNGKAIVNLDCPYRNQWQTRVAELDMISFALESQVADISAFNIDISQQNCVQFDLSCFGQRFPVLLPIAGQHNVANALAAAAAATAIGIEIKHIVTGLETMQGVAGRLNHLVLSDDLLVIDDSYNANVASMKAALDVLKQRQKNSVGIFVMGDMAELGEYSRSAHQEVGDHAREIGIEHIFTLGEFSLHAQQGHENQFHFNQFSALQARLEQLLVELANNKQKACVLVKGSRSAKMERVVEALKQFVSNKDPIEC